MKSPIKSKPLRNPGDSTNDKIYDVLLDEVLKYFIIALLLFLIAMMEWWHWYFNSPPSPILSTIFALGAIAFSIYKFYKGLAKVKNLKLGRDGEKAVGQYLERLRSNGALLLHDFPGDGFNIDHVVVHASGIYAIETKTFSKPDKGEPRIVFDGESVTIFGKKPDRNPVTQARASSNWLREKLAESTGKKYVVRPVVLFPGWYIEPTAEARNTDVWVLNPKALPSFIENSRHQIDEADVHLISSHLSRYARSVLALQ